MKVAIFENPRLENLKGRKNLGLIFTNQWVSRFYYLFREIVEFEGSLMDLSILSKRLHNILKESSASISIMPGKCCILDT
jgi:hypothetical protein